MLRRRKYESRRGFTLVELVVVLVILAVLASVAVPAFSRQIDDAKEKKAVTEAQACVTAATGLTAQKYTEARTAYIQDNSKGITAALATWAGSVQDARPAVTGTLAQREGTGEYLLTPQGTPDGSAAGAAEVKATAGVDGTVLNFWCNANGQIVYLLYKSADDILVAYANNANSGDNGIVIPTANVPTPMPTSAPVPTVAPPPATTPTTTVTPTPTKTPTSTPTTINGPKLIIHLEDATTGADVPLGNYYLVPVINNSKDYSRKLSVSADGNGNIEVGLLPQNNNVIDSFLPDYMTQPSLIEYLPFVLEEESAPAGYQALAEGTNFLVNLEKKGHWDSNLNQWVIDDISLSVLYINGSFNGEYQTTDNGQTTLHVRRYPIPTLDIKTVDSNNIRLSGAKLRLSSAMQNGSVGETIAEVDSSKVNPQDLRIPVKLHEGDNLGNYTGFYIDLTDIYSKSSILTEIQTPDSSYRNAGTQSFTVSRDRTVYTEKDAFDITISADSWLQTYRYSTADKSLKHTIDVVNYPS